MKTSSNSSRATLWLRILPAYAAKMPGKPRISNRLFAELSQRTISKG